MHKKTSLPLWLRASLILVPLISFFVASSGVNAQKPQVSSSGQAPHSSEQERPTKVPSATSPARPEARKAKSVADLPTRRYGVEIEINQITVKLDPLEAAQLEQAPRDQIGKGRTVDMLSSNLGRLIENDDGTKIRAFAITSPGARAIRLHFEDFDIPEGDQVYIYGSAAADSRIAGPYKGKGPFKDGEFWSDSIKGETAIIEHYIRREERALRIPEISHFFKKVRSGVKLNVLGCHEDASCFATVENNTVGRIVYMRGGEAKVCSGTMMVDINGYLPSLFLTANHCVDSEEVARTVETYFFYQSSSCGSQVVSTKAFQVDTGATLVARNEPRESSLIRILHDVPDDLFYSGWDSRPKPVGTRVFGLHHPGADEPPDIESALRKSFGQITSLTATCQEEQLLAGYGITWSAGLTEGGSSGSGIWATENNQNFLIGVLSCNDEEPRCGGVNTDAYGKFADFFPTIQPFIASPPCAQTPVIVGQTVTEQLLPASCQGRRGLARRYTFNALAGQQVQITLESAAFDTYLSLLAPNQGLLAEDDDGGGNLNSRIPAAGVLTIPFDGTYTVEVSSFSGSSVGSFILRLNSSPVNPPVEIKIDDGSFEDSIGLTNGGTHHSVNRITPPSYPATLTDVAIFFNNSPTGGVRAGDPLTVVAGANPSGSLNIDSIVLQRSASIVGTPGQFNIYNIPDITISSGDFIVGFAMTYPAGIFPTALDQSPPFRRQSYFSSNGINFFIIDDISASLAGNFGIRGRVIQASTPCIYNLFPKSQPFTSAGGSGGINVTTANNCLWTATSNSNWIVINSGGSGVGNGIVSFSVLANAGIARAGAITIAGQTFSVTQAAGGPVITNVSIGGKSLFVFGREFAPGANILVNGIAQNKVSNDPINPTTLLIAKKAGKNIARGQSVLIQVRNPNGVVSPQFPWTRP